MLTVAAAPAAAALSAGARRGADPCTPDPGLEGDDRISGGPGADCIDGGPGNDRIAGLAGGDTLEGADGNDILSGGPGADALAGGPGADRLSGGAGADRLSDVAGTYATVGSASKHNRVTAGAGRDRVDTANGHRDKVHCGSGRDLAVADREDTLAGCEQQAVPAIPDAEGRAAKRRAATDVHGALPGAGGGRVPGRAVLDRGDRARGLREDRDELPGHPIPRRRDGPVQAEPFGPDGRGAKRWCRGLYRGTVDFVREPAPPLRIGRFSFRVR